MRQVMPHRNNIVADTPLLQEFSSPDRQSPTEFRALWHICPTRPTATGCHLN